MTQNDPSIVDHSDFTVRRSIRIAASIDKVWAAVTEADLITRWFGDRAIIDRLEVGAGGIFGWDSDGDFAFRIEELDPPHMIAYRWSEDGTGAPLDPARSTVFRFTLKVIAGGTELTVVESGFDTLPDPASALEDHRSGWDEELDDLVASLETRS